jgi:hypothetical protein
MEEGLVTPQGYPIGDLYLMARYEAAAMGDSLFSLEFRDRRPLFERLGVPECRYQSVTAPLIAMQFASERLGIPNDYANGHNLPSELEP